MNTNNPELAIVIPAKNEERYIGVLLESIRRQDYPRLPATEIALADAASDDRTREMALQFGRDLRITIVPGGLPSVGRNAGARATRSRYILFVDADIQLADPTLVRRSLEVAIARELYCATTNIRCPHGTLLDRSLYGGSNILQRLSRLYKPFATGMYMLCERNFFEQLGGFDERVAYAEDYYLTKQVPRKRFGVIPGSVLTTNRRFQKMGRWKATRLFVATALHTWDPAYFYKDHKYFD
jgi:glycosyltransferase involved in cell wall biosynthesis